VDPARYRKYVTGTDRRSVRNPDFLPDKTSLTSEVPFFAQYLTPIGAQTPLIY
jgi:hypothetical protein